MLENASVPGFASSRPPLQNDGYDEKAVFSEKSNVMENLPDSRAEWSISSR